MILHAQAFPAIDKYFLFSEALADTKADLDLSITLINWIGKCAVDRQNLAVGVAKLIPDIRSDLV